MLTVYLFQLVDCTEVLKTNEELVEGDDFSAYAIVFKKPHSGLTIALKDAYVEMAKEYPRIKFVQTRFSDNVDFTTSELSKTLGDSIPKTLVDNLELEPEAVLFLAFGARREVVRTC